LNGAGGNDTLRGGTGGDHVVGGAGDDLLQGGEDRDLLKGGTGDDVLDGGAGADTLGGGAGSDAFRFASPAEGGDRILDFTAGEDRLEVLAPGSGGLLPPGPLAQQSFALGAASAAAPQVVYDAQAGTLSWDPDGTGAGAAVVLATLVGAPPIGAGDILVVAA
jgi:Ca2+-binding RTX toxin-like protein